MSRSAEMNQRCGPIYMLTDWTLAGGLPHGRTQKNHNHVPGALVEASEGVYFAYYQEKRRGRTLREKDERNGAVSYDGLDTPELSGQEMIPDRNATRNDIHRRQTGWDENPSLRFGKDGSGCG